MRGHLSGNASWLKEYLSRFFLVLIIDESYTSQKCSKCWGQLENLQGTVRVLECRNQNCMVQTSRGNRNFLVNKDISAPLNMMMNGINLVLNGRRLEQFPISRRDS